MNFDFEYLLAELQVIAKEAGDAILTIYNQPGDVEVDYKSDDSPLTKADAAANAVIVAGLEKLKYQFPILSEESKATDYEERKSWQTFWLVDPLDGTKEFIKRNGEFTVNIALVDGSRSVLGVVYAPVTEEMFYAAKGLGATAVRKGEQKALKVPSYKTTDSGLRMVTSRSHLNETTAAFLAQYSEPETVAKGSSFKFLMIADGQAEIYPRLAPTMEWDTGAAQIVLEEAGGSVLNHETGKPLEYNKDSLVNPHFVAKGNEVE